MSVVISISGPNLNIVVSTEQRYALPKDTLSLEKTIDEKQILFKWAGNQTLEFPFVAMLIGGNPTPSDIDTAIDQILALLATDSEPTVFIDLDELTAPGVTNAIDVSAFNEVVFQYTITDIDTDVTIRFEGTTEDNPLSTKYSNLDQSEEDTTETTNVTKDAFLFARGYKFVRVRLVSETGGTNVKVNTRLGLGHS